MRFWFSIWVLVQAWTWLPVKPVYGSSIVAWYSTSIGTPQVISYDSASSKVYYSLCNSNGAVIFPFNNTATLDLTYEPRFGTSFAGTGYQQNGVNYAAIFYQLTNSTIVGDLFECGDSGYYKTPAVQCWTTTAEVTWPIQNGTGMQALYLDADGGYRLFYKDNFSRTAALRYTATDGTWKDDGLVSQDQAMAFSISAAFVDSGQITVVNPRNDNVGIEYSVLTGSEWTIDTLPIPLEMVNSTASDGAVTYSSVTNNVADGDGYNFNYNETASQGYTLDGFESLNIRTGVTYSSNGTCSIFYIGADYTVHRIDEINGVWQKATQQNRTLWPISDDSNANFGTAYDIATNRIWIYYFVDNTMTQVYQSSLGAWQAASTLPTSPQDKSAPAGNATNTTQPQATTSSKPNGDLSIGAKSGIGVSVAVAVIASAAAAFLYLRGRRQRKQSGYAPPNSAQGEQALSQPVSDLNPHMSNPDYPGGYWANGQWVPTGPQPSEQGGNWQNYDQSGRGWPIYEMFHPNNPEELTAQEQYHQLPATQNEK